MVQLPSARIIELINNVARRGMAVVKEDVCAVMLWFLWGRGEGGGGWGRKGALQTQTPIQPHTHTSHGVHTRPLMCNSHTHLHTYTHTPWPVRVWTKGQVPLRRNRSPALPFIS